MRLTKKQYTDLIGFLESEQDNIREGVDGELKSLLPLLDIHKAYNESTSKIHDSLIKALWTSIYR